MKKTSKKKPNSNPMRNPKPRKISSTQKLKEEIVRQQELASSWQKRWEETMEGQLQRLKEVVGEACDQLEESSRDARYS